MPDTDIHEVVRSAYRAYQDSDRQAMEDAAAPDYTFSSPDDSSLDRDEYFERCWPNAGNIGGFEIEQILDDGDGNVLVRYTATRADGSRFRNVEFHRVEDGQIQRTEVYYGTEVG